MSVDLSKDKEVKNIFVHGFTRSLITIVNFVKRKTPVDKGILRNSVHWDVQEIKEDVVEYFVGSNIEYAPHVEYGWLRTGTNKKGEKYTFGYPGAFMFQRGIEAAKPTVDKIVRRTVIKAMSKGRWRFLKDFGAKFEL